MAIASGLLIVAAAAVPGRLNPPAPQDRAAARTAGAASLKHDPRFILEAVARKMGIALRPDVAAPTIRLESETPLTHLQVAAEAQLGGRLTGFLNVYIAASNEIYLIDDAALYDRAGRTLDDALAHELVHYLQVQYLHASPAGDWAEFEAAAVQSWFRDRFAAHTFVASRGGPGFTSDMKTVR